MPLALPFYKPIGRDNLHPGYTSLPNGNAHVASVIPRIMKIPNRADTAIIVASDENGGAWDHVPPPKGDLRGAGLRVPAIIFSPYAKRSFVDHTSCDTASIMRALQVRLNLPLLGRRDALVADLCNAFMGAGTLPPPKQ